MSVFYIKLYFFTEITCSRAPRKVHHYQKACEFDSASSTPPDTHHLKPPSIKYPSLFHQFPPSSQQKHSSSRRKHDTSSQRTSHKKNRSSQLGRTHKRPSPSQKPYSPTRQKLSPTKYSLSPTRYSLSTTRHKRYSPTLSCSSLPTSKSDHNCGNRHRISGSYNHYVKTSKLERVDTSHPKCCLKYSSASSNSDGDDFEIRKRKRIRHKKGKYSCHMCDLYVHFNFNF